MDDLTIEANVRGALAAALAGTDYLPANVLITDVVCAIGYVDADSDFGYSVVRCGSPWSARGLMVMAEAAMDEEADAG